MSQDLGVLQVCGVWGGGELGTWECEQAREPRWGAQMEESRWGRGGEWEGWGGDAGTEVGAGARGRVQEGSR